MHQFYTDDQNQIFEDKGAKLKERMQKYLKKESEQDKDNY